MQWEDMYRIFQAEDSANGRLLWTGQFSVRLHKITDISCKAQQLLASEKGLCFLELLIRRLVKVLYYFSKDVAT